MRPYSEQVLRALENRYGPLPEGVPSVAYIFEPGVEGRCLYISPSVEDVLGYPRRQWLEERGLWDRILHPDDEERVVSNEAECARSGEKLMQEYRLRSADGRDVWIRDEMTVVFDRQTGGGPALLRRLPGRLRPQADGDGARAPRALRPPHRAAQPGAVRGPAAAGARAPRAWVGHSRLLPRPGSLQAHQRLARPRRRRRRAARGRRAPEWRGAARGHGRALRRGRVHDRVRARRRGAGGGVDRRPAAAAAAPAAARRRGRAAPQREHRRGAGGGRRQRRRPAPDRGRRRSHVPGQGARRRAHRAVRQRHARERRAGHADRAGAAGGDRARRPAPLLPAGRASSAPARWWAPRRWCAGSTPSAG